MLDAFWDLSGGRQFGAMGGYQPLPVSEIGAYAARIGPHDPEAFRDFLKLIRALDRAWLIDANKPRPKTA